VHHMANDIGIVLQKAIAKLLTMKRLPYFSEREGNFRWSDL
jgi:imidazoleglycerol phosphate dehydratase HisB